MTFVAQSIQGRMIGQYMVLSGGNSPNQCKVFDIETRAVGTYTIVNNVATLTPPSLSFTQSFKWNANGTSFGIVYGTSPFISFYNKIGNTYTRVADLSPTGNGAMRDISWHPNGVYIVAASEQASNTIGAQAVLIKRTGDSFSTVSNAFSGITATIQLSSINWNPQGDTVAISCFQAPWVLIYKWNPATENFTKIVNPLSSHPTAICDQVAWSPDGKSLIVCSRQTSNQFRVYNREGDTFVLAFTANIGGDVTNAAWGGAQGEQIVIGIGPSPRIGFFYRPPGTTSTFLRAANPNVLPTNGSLGVDISADGLFAVTSVFTGVNTYFRRDPATTSTWINLGLNPTGNPTTAKRPHIYQGYQR